MTTKILPQNLLTRLAGITNIPISTPFVGIPASTRRRRLTQVPANHHRKEIAMSEKKEATAFETVTMTDGRIVEFAGKRKLLKTSEATPEGQVQVRLDFRNGESRLFTIPDNMIHRMAAHGAEQKLGDEIAGLTDVDDCVIAVDELIDRLYNGEWGVKRESNGMAGTSVLVRALVEHTGKTVEAIKSFLSGKSQAEKVALRNNPKIKPIIEQIESEKASKGGSKVDTDAMLGELEA